MTAAAIAVSGLSFDYGGVPVLREVSLEVGAGEVLAVVGPNGSGKTTLLKNLSGVLGGAAQRRCVRLGSRSLSDLSPRDIARIVAVLEAEVETYFDFSVRELVELGRIPYLNRLQALGKRDRDAVDRALDVTKTRVFSERPLSSLSSGERQRAWLAMALAQEPEIFLLDEPTSHLDLAYQVEILELLRSLAARGLSVVFSVHDLNLAALFADRVALLDRGRLATVAPPAEALTAEHIREVYGTSVRVLSDPETGEFRGIIPERRPGP